MNISKLSLDTIPPILTPFRFFLTAPLFGVIAAILMLYGGPDIWLSRWSNSNLALTHLLTLGFMLMVMIGALYQFIPVMNGHLVPGSKTLAAVIHILMVTGVMLLVPGFLYNSSVFFWLAFIALSGGLVLFALSLLPLLISRLGNQLIVYLLRVLYLVLLITLGLGLFLLLGHAVPELGLAYRSYTDLHAMWGLLGWVVLIIMAISSQVIPMFYVITEFSRRYLKGLSLAMILTLIAISYYQGRDLTAVSAIVLEILLSIELLIFVFYTLLKIEQRKRKIADVTINFYRLSLFSLLLAVILWWCSAYFEESISAQQLSMLLAILLIYGLAIAIISGMLHKIVSFLIFLHLQKLSLSRPEAMTLVPNMKQVISARDSQIQFMLYILSGSFLLLSVFYPALTLFAAVLMLFNFSWLSYCLIKAYTLYFKSRRQILDYPEMPLSW